MRIIKALGLLFVSIILIISFAIIGNFIMKLDIPIINDMSQPIRDIASQASSGGAEKINTNIDVSELPSGNDTLPLPYYYNNLPADQQAIYSSILDGLYAMDEKIEIPSCNDIDVLKKIFEFILFDHDEIFWVDNTFEYDYFPNGTIHAFKPHYTIDAEDREKKQAMIDDAVTQIISDIPQDADDYTKAKHVYTELSNLISYDINAIDSQNIVSPLINKVTSCAGYSKAFQYIMGKLDIPCIYISGQADGGDGNITNHAWNIICIDGTLTYVDLTWGDGVKIKDGNNNELSLCDYSYLCVSDDLLKKDHSLDYDDIVPDCTSNDYLYSKLVGSYWDAYDEQNIRNRVYSGFVDGDEMIYLQFSNDEAYLAALNAISNTNLPFECAYGAATANGTQIVNDTCNIYKSDSMRIAMIVYDMNGDGIISQK